MIIPVASGKGGVGKSLVAANLGVSLARLGRTVILVDLDFGGANLHSFLGMRRGGAGIGGLHWKQEKNLSALLTETGEERLWLIPGDSLLPGVANIEWQVKKMILKDLAELPADFIILDLGTGSSWNTVDFWLAGKGGIVVVIPEITSVLNAFALLKSAAYRLLSQGFPEGSSEKATLLDFASTWVEGSEHAFADFAKDLARRSPARGEAVLRSVRGILPCLVINRGRYESDVEAGHMLRDLVAKNLGFTPYFGAFIPEDHAVSGSLVARRPLVTLDPEAPFSRALRAFAGRLASAPQASPLRSPQPLVDVDLLSLAREALGQ
ncbi:MAG: P-loop NTPase [Spirochaetota bacterium]